MNDTCICIDAGHGGNDSGCVFADNNYEKTYNLSLANNVYDIVKKHYKHTYIDRKSDITIEPSGRIAWFNEYAKKYKKVDGYSFHCNACQKHNGRGSEILLSKNKNYKPDIDWSIYILKEFAKKFDLKNRPIVYRILDNGADYYYLHRKTSKNVNCKIWEIGFGDNKNDLTIMKTHKNDIAFFIARNILLRYDIDIKKNDNEVYTYRVQCGSFAKEDNAIALQKRLIKAGFEAIIEKEKK